MGGKSRLIREGLERYLVPKRYRADADTVELQERGKAAEPSLTPEEQAALQPAPEQPTPAPATQPEAPVGPAESAAPEPGVFEQALDSQDLFTDPMPGRPPDVPDPAGRDLEHRTPTRNINLDRVRTPDDVKALIDETAQVTGPEETVTHRQVSARAGKVDVIDLLGGGKPSDAWNPQQLLAARRLMVAEAERLHEMAVDLSEREGITPNSVSMAEWANFASMKARYIALQKVVQGKVRLAAQTLNSLAITAGPTAKAARLQEMDALLSSQGGPREQLRQAQLLASADPEDNPSAFGKAASRISSLGSSAYSIWINGLLSSPPTHFVNVLSNALVKVYEEAVINPLGGAIGNVRQGVGVLQGKNVTDRMGLEESHARIAGMVSGILDGVVTATSRALGPPGTPGIGRGTKVEARQHVLDLGNPVADYLADMVLQGPSRFLDGEDQFFKVLSYREQLNVEALRIARREGLSGETFGQRVGELVNNPTEDMHLKALEVAEKLTFTNNPADARGVALVNPEGYPTLFGMLAEAGQTARKFGPLGYVIPFVRTPANLANYAVKNLPVLNTLQIMQEIRAGGAKADEAMARLTVSWSALYAIWEAADEGVVTGSGSPNLRLQQVYRDSGWQPYSIKVGDTWMHYDRMDPIGLVIGALVDARESINHSKDPENVAQTTMAALLGVANNLRDSTYLQGVSELLTLLKQGDSQVASAVKWIGGTAASFAPYSAMMGYVARSGDVDEQGQAMIRDAYKLSMTDENPLWMTTMRQFMNRSPWGRNDLPLKVNWRGEYAQRDYGGYWDEAFPVKYAEVRKDPVAAALWENRVAVNPPLPLMRWSDPVDSEHESASGTWQPTHVNLLDLDGGRGEVYEQYQVYVGRARYRELQHVVKGYEDVQESEKGSYTQVADDLKAASAAGTREGKEEFMAWYTGVAESRGWLVPGTEAWATAADAVRPSVQHQANPNAPTRPPPADEPGRWGNVRF